MQHAMMQTIVLLAIVNGVHGTWQQATQIQPSKPRPFMPFRAPTHYMSTRRTLPLRSEPDDAALATDETPKELAKDGFNSISPQGTGIVNGVVGVPKLQFKAPQAKPTLYSQGIMGKPKPKQGELFEIKIGKGLIGEGALLGGPYKPPVEKPSLYSQGYTGKKLYQSPQPVYGSPSGWQANAVSPAMRRAMLQEAAMPDSRAASAASVDDLMPDSRTTAEKVTTPVEATDEMAAAGAGNKPQLEAEVSSAGSLVPLALLSSAFVGLLYFRRRTSTCAKESLLTAA